MAQQGAYDNDSKDFTEDRLMEVPLNKYKILIESNKWNTPMVQDSKLLPSLLKLTHSDYKVHPHPPTMTKERGTTVGAEQTTRVRRQHLMRESPQRRWRAKQFTTGVSTTSTGHSIPPLTEGDQSHL